MKLRASVFVTALKVLGSQQQRLLSVAPHIIKSPLPDVELPTLTLPDYVWGQVDRWPDKIAFECGVTGRKHTYARARELCKKFAASLSKAGLKTGDKLLIVMPNTPEWPIIMLGAMEANLTVTTANPSYTAEEISKQLRDCPSQVIVTLPGLYPVVRQAVSLAGYKTQPLTVIAPGAEASNQIPAGTVDLWEMMSDNVDTSGVRCRVDVDDIAVLPYSSGTTGLPKGVMLSHRNLVSNCAQLNGHTDICLTEETTDSYQDVLPVVLPFFHVYGMVVIMLCKLLHGSKLVTLPRFEPNLFTKVLQQYKATVVCVAPPLLLFMGSHPGLQPKHLESLRYVLSGAAPLGEMDIERFLKRASSSTKVLQAYGMTEASPAVAHMQKNCKKLSSVGIPIPNTELKVTHVETGNVLKPGEVGEVCIKGPQVMKGYFNHPEATAEIINDEGWLRTGDLGYLDKEGSLYVVDRLKELIKVKGFQVAPAELEEILRSHPQIADAAVIGIPDERAGEVPKAFVVPKTDNLSKEEVQKFVASKVSDYKRLKGGVNFVESIPKNPSGKILRRKLKELI